MSAPATKLDHALAHARNGFPVFPVIENGKSPQIPNWRNLATTDESQVRQWWEQSPRANIGIATDQFVVIDIDPRKGGAESYQQLTLVEEFPKTARSDTWSGGAHILYRLPPDTPPVKGGVNVLGPGLDIRAWGGLIVAPGSMIDGKEYRWGNDRPVGEAPPWLLERCKASRARTEAAGKRLIAEDDKAVELAESWLLNNAPEASTGAIDDTAFMVAAKLYDYGVTPETCLELMQDWSFNRCHPPMELDRLKVVTDSASRNRDNAIGVLHPDLPVFEPVEIAPRKKTEPVVAEGRRDGLYCVSFHAGAKLALSCATEPLIDGLIDCATMSIIYGESNSGKSFTELDKDFHIAAGLPWAGMAVKQGPVIYIASEGGHGIFKRLAALQHRYKRDDVPLFVVPCPVNLLRSDADLKPLIALIQGIAAEHGPVVKVTIDTLSRVIAGGEENSSVDMGALVRHFDAIRDQTGAHLAVVHHTGKDKAKGARGHSLLRAATDTEIEIADRKIKVTKQRDMDGTVELRFTLSIMRVGVDARGRAVTSCFVELRHKDKAAEEPMTLTKELQEFIDDLKREIPQQYDTSPENVYSQAFTTGFASRRMLAMERASDMSLSTGKDAVRKRVERLMDNLTDYGHLRKGQRDQWFIVKAT